MHLGLKRRKEEEKKKKRRRKEEEKKKRRQLDYRELFRRFKQIKIQIAKRKLVKKKNNKCKKVILLPKKSFQWRDLS